MKRKQSILPCLVLTLALPLLAQAQSKLILPQSQDDIRQLTTKAAAGPCERCGVVTDVRSDRRQPTAGRASLATTPIAGKGSAVRDARDANKPTTFYKMTVRFDDGTYSFFEQDDQPAVRQGDRVEIVDGRVEPRADQ